MKKKIVIVQLNGPRQLVTIEENLDLTRLKDNEVAAETHYTAISPGTEVAAYRGDPPLRPMKVYPRAVGYCNVSEVVALGRNVIEYEVGDFILSFQSHRSGFVCPVNEIIAKIPAEADLVEATATYLFHLGYDALLKGDLKPGHNVAVIGLGTIGLTTVALASLFGANVYALSNQDTNLRMATELGAHCVMTKERPNATTLIDEFTRGTGIDMVITTSNSWKDWELAMSLPRKGGKVCVIGFPGRTVPVPPFNPLASKYFYDRQLSLIACGYTPDYQIPAHDIRFTIKRSCMFLLDQIVSKRLPARKIISRTVSWEKLEDLYRIMSARESPILTAVLKWK